MALDARVKSRQSRCCTAKGFTLVELLVVIGIIAVLISLLMPALSKARAQALSVKCESNMHEIGQSILMFANDHNGRVPANQSGWYGNGMPFWCNYMYSHDYFELVDEYGANRLVWGCPANPPSDDPNGIGYVGYDNYSQSEAQARAASDALTPAQTGGDADNISWSPWPGVAATGGIGGAGCIVDLVSYSYMGSNNQFDPTQNPPQNQLPASNWWVNKLSDKTFTGTYVDTNPPLLCDFTLQQAGVQMPFNHGTHWSVCTNANGLMTANQLGDVRINELYVDGHVENKTPDAQAYWYTPGAYWAWR